MVIFDKAIKIPICLKVKVKLNKYSENMGPKNVCDTVLSKHLIENVSKTFILRYSYGSHCMF